ncbi:thioredoxin domain-containing protein [Candidatus Saccharibacteria bacterium]|nr:MAG: thioredoxin domain-containing protein [Candidatus Saccharibacteria bacterium]
MKKMIIVMFLVILAVIGVFLVFSGKDSTIPIKQNETNTPSLTSNVYEAKPNATPTELVIGKASAPITIVEYGDYKCPKCNELHEKAGKDIRRDWVDTGKAKIIYRPFPLLVKILVWHCMHHSVRQSRANLQLIMTKCLATCGKTSSARVTPTLPCASSLVLKARSTRRRSWPGRNFIYDLRGWPHSC